MFFILNILSILLIFLKPKTQTDSPVSIKRAKAVFVIIIAEQILNCAENAQIKPFAAERKVVAACQIGAAIAVKAKNPGRKTEWREITARREKIERRPSAFESLRRNERELMLRNAERFDDADGRNLRRALVAVGESVRGENVSRIGRAKVAAEFAAAGDAAFRVQITAERSGRIGNYAPVTAEADSVNQSCVKINRRQFGAVAEQILFNAGVESDGSFRYQFRVAESRKTLRERTERRAEPLKKRGNAITVADVGADFCSGLLEKIRSRTVKSVSVRRIFERQIYIRRVVQTKFRRFQIKKLHAKTARDL